MKNNKKLIILMLLVSLVALQKDAKATTLKEYEDAVAKYTKELQDKESQIAKNEKEVEAINKKIASLAIQIQNTETEIEKIKREIEECNKEIEEKKEETKQLIQYFQIADGDNAYLEYAFGAETITDMIYRSAVVEQITEYNDQIMNDLEDLVKKNKVKNEELEKKSKNLANLKKELQVQKQKIDADTAAIEKTVPSVKEQIKTYQNQVNYWKNKGCKSNDVLGVTCAVPPKVQTSSGATSILGSNGFRIPMDHGYVTQGYVGRYGHMGIDLSSNNKSEPIYPIANGLVIYVGQDKYGANVVKIVHNVNGKLVFSTYAHMRTVYLRKNQTVTTNTRLGLMGSTGWSTGPHLHLEMTTCDWTYNCTYNTYLNSLINPWNYVPKVSRW